METLLLGGLFSTVSSGIGYLIFRKLWDVPASGQRFLLSTGAGVGGMGMIGFFCAVSGLASGWLMFSIQAVLFVFLLARGMFSIIFLDLKELIANLRETSKHVPRWLPIFAVSFFCLSLILSLAPPFEGFDGVFYHLTVPTLWIRDDGLSHFNMPHYWFPALMEGMFVFPLSLGFDHLAQWIHLCLGVLGCLLIWDLTCHFVEERAAWWSIAILLSMPSLPLMAAWAYTDLGLAFYSLSALVSLWNWKLTGRRAWLLFCGGMSGLALGIKYTGFVLPLVILFFILLYSWRQKQRLLFNLLEYSFLAVLTGGIWYLRNWIWTGNPVYPFVFGGLFWDAFRADWYSGSGTGIGWNLLSILTLPFVTMLGYQDQNYYDGRMGPLYLVLLPVSLFFLWKLGKRKSLGEEPIFILLCFSAAASFFWLLGVIQSESLLQARLLWPGLFAFVPIMAAGILELKSLDMPKFRLSFIFSALTGILVFFFLLDFALFVWVRNPVSVVLGLESKETYIAFVQPDYLQALNLVEKSPPDAYIYFVNEPRSYGMSRRVQPDPIRDNLPHDFYLYSANNALLDSWRKLGYTHILFRKDFVTSEYAKSMPPVRMQELFEELTLVEETEDYILYAIPPAK